MARIGEHIMHIDLWLGNVTERTNLEDPHVDGRITLKCILKKQDGKAWTGFEWLRIWTSEGILWTW